MSVVVHAAATVAATPVPSPQVIKETFTNTVPAQVPAVVVQGAQLAGLFVAAFILSVVHRIAEWATAKEKGWGPKVNTLIATGYSIGVGLVGTATMNKFAVDVAGLVALAANTFPALAGSFWTYALRTKLFAGLAGLFPSKAASAAALPADQAPVEGNG